MVPAARRHASERSYPAYVLPRLPGLALALTAGPSTPHAGPPQLSPLPPSPPAHPGTSHTFTTLPTPSHTSPVGGPGPNVANTDDFIAGYFDKYVSDDSARFLESMKWQRRFFVFSESQRVLYYFKSPEDVSKPSGLRGQVNVAGGKKLR